MMAIIIKSVFDSKNIQLDTQSIAIHNTIHLAHNRLFGMLPDVAWLPTAMIISSHVCMDYWQIGKFPVVDYLDVCRISNRLQQQCRLEAE